MKKSIYLSKLFATSLVITACLVNGCEEDETFVTKITGDSTNKVYINTQTSYVNNYKLAVVHTPLSSMGDIEVEFPARCTNEATTSMNVTFALDNSLVDTYNAQHLTTYSEVPSGLVTLENNMLTIPKGGLASTDSLKVYIPDNVLVQLTEDEYLVPIKITSVSGAKNVAISTNLSIVYITITTSFTNCYDSPEEEDMEGDLIADRSAWSATLDVELYSGSLDNMFNGNTRSYWRVRPSQECTLVVDLAAEYAGITGIRINTYRNSYNLTTINVYSSSDGVTWESQGEAVLATGETEQYIKFYSPLTARYLKFEITGWVSSSYIRVAEFDVYTNT